MSEIKVPELAESITEGTIANWLKSEGETVAQDEPVAELETDKVNIEVNAPADGVLQKIVKQIGDTVEVGETIAILAAGGEAPTGDAAPAKTAGPTAAPTPVPAAQDAQDAPLATSAEGLSGEMPAATEPARPGVPPVASPATRRLARERGIDLNQVQGIGRITPEDVAAHANAPAQAAAPQPAPSAPKAAQANAPQVEGEAGKPVVRERMSRRRQTIANRLVEVQQTAAMLTTFNEVDMTAILDVRKRWKEPFLKQHGVKLGFMSFFTKAVVGALKQFPLLNAEIDGQDMLIKKYYDIGIAVASDAGLVVPVVRDADRRSFAEIESDIASLAEKARSNKLSLQDLQGGTFTITNGGIFGSLLSTPILNGPQVGILGMHTIQKRPVAVGDDIELRPMMYIALSYDHRIVDGKEAVSFLVKVKQMLEDPESLLLEG